MTRPKSRDSWRQACGFPCAIPVPPHPALGLGCGGVAVGAAASVSAVAEMTAADAAPSEDGYRESAHVRDYYRTAKI